MMLDQYAASAKCSGNSASNRIAVPGSEVGQAVDRLRLATQTNAKVLMELATKIEPVMRPEPPVAAVAGGSVVDERVPSCALSQQLDELARIAEGQTRHIEQLLARLAL